MLRLRILADCRVFVHGKERPVQKGDEFEVSLYNDVTTYNWISSLLASKVIEIIGWTIAPDGFIGDEERLLKLYSPQSTIKEMCLTENSTTYLLDPATKEESKEDKEFDRMDFVE